MEQNNQKKHKNIGLRAIIALLLTIIIISSSTGLYAWAKYKSILPGNGEAQVAKWYFDVKLKEGKQNSVETTEPINLASTQYEHVQTGKIAPGTSGLFYVVVDTSNTEVDVLYTVNMALENCPRNIKFYKGTDDSGELLSGGTNSRTRSFSFSRYLEVKKNENGTIRNENGKYEEPIFWKWDYTPTGEGANETEYNRIDTEDSGLDATMTISVTGVQMIGKPLSTGTLKRDNQTISNGSTIELSVSDTTQLSVVGAEEVTYSSSDPTVATVGQNTGLITAVSSGTSTITITGRTTGQTMSVITSVSAQVAQVDPPAIGNEVSFTTSLNGVSLSKWKVFDNQEVNGVSYTYLILDGPLHSDAVDDNDDVLIPELEHMWDRSNDYCIGTAITPIEDAKNTFVSAMNNRTYWQPLVTNGVLNNNSIASSSAYAIGSPTLQMFADSWNKSYPSNTIDVDVGSSHNEGATWTGYKMKYTSSNTWDCTLDLEIPSNARNNTLYFPEDSIYENEKINYWLATECDYEDVESGMFVDSYTPGISYDDITESNADITLRPVICIPTSLFN